MTPGAFSHTGSSGAVVWGDPGWDVVGVLLYVRQNRDGWAWPDDLFINAVTACIVA